MRIAVIGAGNMGGWIVSELAKKGNPIAVYDTDIKKAERLEGINGVSVLSWAGGLKEFAPEMLINAVNLGKTIEVFEGVCEFIPKECILVDVTSIKGDLPEYYKECGFMFVSVHPMFGPTFANVENLKEENAVIIADSCDAGKEFFKEFFLSLGLNLYEYGFSEHERMMAYSLALPFASSMVFAACMDKSAVPGTTFAKQKRLAKGLLSEDDRLLAEILFNPEALVQIEKVTGRLEYLKHIIRGKDFKEAERFFEKLRENLE